MSNSSEITWLSFYFVSVARELIEFLISTVRPMAIIKCYTVFIEGLFIKQSLYFVFLLKIYHFMLEQSN